MILLPRIALADPWQLPSIDGGQIDLAAHEGPILVVNTASLCAFTPQYEALQRLHETYRDQGLLVLAVPSDDFRQELGSEEEVRDFCELTYGIDLPMTEIISVTGPEAHPLYRWIKIQSDFSPQWNFNKVLIDEGVVLATWGASARPMSRAVRNAVETALQ